MFIGNSNFHEKKLLQKHELCTKGEFTLKRKENNSYYEFLKRRPFKKSSC